MKLVSWNIRGLNKSYKQNEMQRYIKEHNISILDIIEHRVQEKYSQKIIQKIAPKWEWCANYDSGDKGRIWVIWDPNKIKFTMLGYKPQYIHGEAFI